ncbi:hypothetical protein TWF718_002663 [Orbilia javanica]|uniref:Uncharacterized protein n=1 Tax=Orbilia javanica TaxID=47235 RepID=A0AAN8RBM2_9PEZI
MPSRNPNFLQKIFMLPNSTLLFSTSSHEMEKSSSKRRRDSLKPAPKQQQPSQSPPGKSDSLPSKKSKKPKKDASAGQKSASDPIRLHIAPLTAESAKAIVAAKHLSTASFHAIDTFPEKSYGFVTLPRAEAEALRRKYNGTVFRGVKMSVEEARPAKEAVLSPNGNGAGKSKETSPPMKNKKEDGVLSGFELPEGRQVKRGWTKDATSKTGKSKGKPSAGTSECLFKTVLPPVIASEIKKSDLGEDKSGKKKSKGRTVKNQVVVKEFKNSTKFPSFLKMSSLPTDSAERSAEFVEGVGWVNDSGEVIEGAPAKRRKLSVQEESPKESEGEKDSSSGEDDDSQEEPSRETKAPDSKPLATSSSTSDTSESEDDSESDSDSGSESESANGRVQTPPGKANSNPESMDEASQETSGSSPSKSTSDQSSSSSSGSESESESESEPKPSEVQEPESAPAAEPTAKQPSSNFANLTSIFKPKLSLDTEATSQFKFFGADLDESDDQEEKADSEVEDDQHSANRFDDSVLYTPITPQAERYRSGAPTPDTAVAPRFKDFLPFPKDFEISIERDYFPTIKAGEKDAARKPSTGLRLLFPHTYDDNLLAISIWGSVNLPKILTTGELPEKQAPSEQDTSNAQNTGNAEKVEPEEKTERLPIARQPTVAPKRTDNFPSNEVEQPKTGSGSKIVGWAGKKRTFGDDDDFDMLDAPAPVAPKARTGAGSGVVGWSGKKKTFDDDEDDFSAPAPVVEHQAKAKTGAGSGVTGWAGKKKTFDDNDDDFSFATPAEVPTKAKTGAGSGVTAWTGKKKTFDDDEDDDKDIEETVKPTAPKAPVPAGKSKQKPQEEDDDSESEKTQLSIAQAWEKVFYENRGDWNRQWKRKKREVAKAKRKKERVKRGWTGLSA